MMKDVFTFNWAEVFMKLTFEHFGGGEEKKKVPMFHSAFKNTIRL